MELTRLDHACPKCGASGEARILWPPVIVVKFIEIVAAQDISERDSLVVAVVFLATAYEAAFEQVLWRLVFQRSKDPGAAETTMDKMRGMERRLRLFRTLTKTTIDQVWNTPTLAHVEADWAKLREKRNKVAHGRFYHMVTTGHELEIALVERLVRSFFPAFAALENHVQSLAFRAVEQSAQ